MHYNFKYSKKELISKIFDISSLWLPNSKEEEGFYNIKFSIFFTVTLQALEFMSQKIPLRLSFFVTTAVVPPPKKKSATVSPGLSFSRISS